MRSEAQRDASRINGSKSKGPKTIDGKNTSKMNRLTHGLRSDQAVLPGESAAEFQAELEGFRDDWRPASHTASVLVERATIASWRVRRCVRTELDMIMDLAVRAGDRGRDRDDSDAGDSLDRSERRLDREPARALAELRRSPEGVDRLIARWDGLDEVLAGGAGDWFDDDVHDTLLALLGHVGDDEPADVGPMAVDSDRLRTSNNCDYIADRLPGAEADAMAARLRAGIAREREALKALRRDLVRRPAPRDEPGDADQVDGGLKFVGVTRKIALLHRYEMAHERSLRSAIRDLIALEKARPGLGRVEDDETEVVEAQSVTPQDPEESGDDEPGCSPAPNEPEPRGDSGASVGPRSGSRGYPRRPRGAPRGRGDRRPEIKDCG